MGRNSHPLIRIRLRSDSAPITSTLIIIIRLHRTQQKGMSQKSGGRLERRSAMQVESWTFLALHSHLKQPIPWQKPSPSLQTKSGSPKMNSCRCWLCKLQMPSETLHECLTKHFSDLKKFVSFAGYYLIILNHYHLISLNCKPHENINFTT